MAHTKRNQFRILFVVKQCEISRMRPKQILYFITLYAVYQRSTKSFSLFTQKAVFTEIQSF